jgi:hypothetical protein
MKVGEFVVKLIKEMQVRVLYKLKYFLALLNYCVLQYVHVRIAALVPAPVIWCLVITLVTAALLANCLQLTI